MPLPKATWDVLNSLLAHRREPGECRREKENGDCVTFATTAMPPKKVQTNTFTRENAKLADQAIDQLSSLLSNQMTVGVLRQRFKVFTIQPKMRGAWVVAFQTEVHRENIDALLEGPQTGDLIYAHFQKCAHIIHFIPKRHLPHAVQSLVPDDYNRSLVIPILFEASVPESTDGDVLRRIQVLSKTDIDDYERKMIMHMAERLNMQHADGSDGGLGSMRVCDMTIDSLVDMKPPSDYEGTPPPEDIMTACKTVFLMKEYQMSTSGYPCANCQAEPGADAKPFAKCGKCRTQSYCSVDCQRAHWRAVHAQECKSRKEMRGLVMNILLRDGKL